MAATRAILKGIIAEIDADTGVSGLYTAVSGRRYLSRQVDRTTGGGTTKYPFVVVEMVAESPTGELGGASGDTIERYLVQITVLDNSDANSPATCATVQDKVRTLFDRAYLDLSGDGHGNAACVREGGTGPARIDQAWQATTDYMIVFV